MKHDSLLLVKISNYLLAIKCKKLLLYEEIAIYLKCHLNS